ncbi:hypothetical protein AB5J56_25720 [Streptomyces sp. R21]|jgi:hypothetical protein|uniref:Uncharacterized protein n=1 Tax=Streptomyces sp. R21 TaxID=3238627 RepID=A0AB39PDM8_9ACTN
MSRATAKRGSTGAEADADAVGRVGPGTGTGVPDVGSADDVDDSCCFDLSGDSPATDASSMRRPPAPNRTMNP